MDAQTRIQNLMNSLGEGWGRAALRAFIAAALLLLVFVWYAAHQFGGLRDARSMELAQLARHLAVGRGFVTDCLRPADLGFLERAGRRPAPAEGIPDLRQAPAYPVLLSLGLRARTPAQDQSVPGALFEPETHVILPLEFACILLTGLLILSIGSRLFDLRVGVTAFAAYAVSDCVLQTTLGGGPTPLAMLLTTSGLGLALAAGGLRARQAHPATWVTAVVLSGVMAGLATLTVYALAVVPIVAVGLLAAGFVRWRAWVVALFLIVAVGVVAPWLVRNQRVCGQPLGLAPYTALNASGLYAGDGWDRETAPQIDSRDVVQALQRKFVMNVGELYDRNLFTLGDGLVMAFFLIALFHRFDGEQADRLKWALTSGMALCMAVAAFGRPDEETLMPFLPLVVLMGVAMLYKLLDESPFLSGEVRSVVVVGWVALAALPAVLVLMVPAARWAYPPYAPALIQYVGSLMKPGEVLATDIPAGVAWYGGRAALRIPGTTDKLVDLRNQGLPLGGVYLTTVTGDQPYRSGLVEGPDRSWRPLLDQLVPEDFPWQHGIALPPGTRDQIFLTDAARWPESTQAPKPQPNGRPHEFHE